MTYMNEGTNLTESIKQLEEIAEWFENQQDVDVEEGLTKVKEAAVLIKKSKARLAAIDNEFRAIEKDITGENDDDIEGANAPTPPARTSSSQDFGSPIGPNGIQY